MASVKKSRLARAVVPMPAFVRRALSERGLLTAYRERPAYQQNDYLGWIAQAKRDDTKDKRLQQMLAELQRGGVYMNMRWRASGSARSTATRRATKQRAARKK